MWKKERKIKYGRRKNRKAESNLSGENPVAKMMEEPSMEAMKDYAESYPAHLHIDLLPECQRKGIGRQLIETLAAHLRAQGVKGLMLDVVADNSGKSL